MKIKKRLLSATLAMAFAMGLAGQAHAYVYAGSSVYIDGLLIGLTDSSGQDIPDAATSFNFDVSALARIVPGGTEAWSNTCGTFGSACGAVSPVLELEDGGGTPTAANATGNDTDRGAQDFSIWGPASGNGEYSTANAEIDTAQLTQGIPSSTNQISEVEIDSAKTEGNGNSVLGSQTDFTLEFTIENGFVGPVTLTIDFDADPYLLVDVNEDPNEQGQSRASHTAVVSMQGDGGSFSWSPQGTAANDCLASGGLVCSETSDTQDLNETLSTGPDNGSEALSVAAGFTQFGIIVTGLTAGDYSLSLAANTLDVVSRESIPEPGTLLLLGSGLMGITLSRRMRRRKTGAA